MHRDASQQNIKIYLELFISFMKFAKVYVGDRCNVGVVIKYILLKNIYFKKHLG